MEEKIIFGNDGWKNQQDESNVWKKAEQGTTESPNIWVLAFWALLAVALFHWWHRPATTKDSSLNGSRNKTKAEEEEERRLRRSRLALAATSRHTTSSGMELETTKEMATKRATTITVEPQVAATTPTKTALPQAPSLIKKSSVIKTITSQKLSAEKQQQQPSGRDENVPTPTKEVENPGGQEASSFTQSLDELQHGRSISVHSTPTPSSPNTTTISVNATKIAASTTIANSDQVTVIQLPNTGSSNKDSSMISGKTKKLILPPPPVQILCHALSWIVQQEVQVEYNEEAGTWGGMGWKPSLPLSASFGLLKSSNTSVTAGGNALQLAFCRWYHLYHPNNNGETTNTITKSPVSSLVVTQNDQENEWKALLAAFSHILQDPELVRESSEPNGQGWRLKNLRQALQWHHQAESLIRNEGSPLIQWWTTGTGKNQSIMAKSPWPFVSSAVQMFQNWLLQQVVLLWLGPPEELRIANDNDAEDEDDLFQDDYDPSSVARFSSLEQEEVVSSALVATTAPTDSRDTVRQLLTLLEFEEMGKVIVTNSFLDSLFQEYQSYFQERLPHTYKEGKTLFLAEVLLSHSFLGLRDIIVHHQDSPPSPLMIRRRVAACTQLCTRSDHVIQALVDRFEKESDSMRSSTNSKSGRDVERSVLIQPMCWLAAFTVPDVATLEAGDEMNGASKGVNLLLSQLQTLKNFPLCAFSKNRHEADALHQQLDECQITMRLARQASTTFLSRALSKNKHHVLRWLAAITSTNETLASVVKWELLASDGVAALSASPSFLLGLTSTLVNFCSRSLFERFEKQGIEAFDCNYLVTGRSELRFDENSMVPSQSGRQDKELGSSATNPELSIKFAGATEFFFLTGSLLRVSLYPVLRVEEAFHQKYSKLFTLLGAPTPELPLSLMQSSVPLTTALLGWSCFLNETDFVASITDFALLQLRWLTATAKRNSKALEIIPDWMCKEPAWWLAHVARNSAHNLKPFQANAAVDCATELLQFGSNAARGRAAFSPVVLTELIRIAAAFVQAGVSRAKRRQQLRKRRHSNESEFSDASDDDHNVDAYLSFDQNDLGVTVFTNRLVCSQLCPALITSFSSLDIVEGLDVDKEHSFDKYSAKVEIGELLLRLWSHPNGECRTSIIMLPEKAIAKFAASLAAAIGFLLDDAIHRFADVCRNRKRKSPSVQDQQFAERQVTSAVGGCLGARRLLLLICHLSHDDRLAAIMGGGCEEASSVCSDLANMVIHFVINLLTTPEGGTKPDLETMGTNESTQSMFLRFSDMTKIEKGALVTEILRSRHFATREIGLDVALVCHMFLALSARWYKASKSVKEVAGDSPLLNALATNDDCDVSHLRKIYERLVMEARPLLGTDEENAYTIFKHDGYVDSIAWLEKYHVTASSEIQKDRWRRARYNMMTREDVFKIATVEDILVLLDDLDGLLHSKSNGTPKAAFDLDRAKETILRAKSAMSEEVYGKHLSNWIVSSDSFANPSDPTSFMHYYDKTAQSRVSSNSGKQLVYEARRCHKGLPTPHSNSASFVCFDESRMDLCRAIVTGPSDTPYAHGIFVFDVFFPPTFPQIPPLVTFMTTGGGTTRFGPNLYQDGKVCFSLLGTFHALDESERWNPGVSSLAQILLSIQTQLLTTEPYFNEPGVEIMQGTPTGDDNSRRYNSSIRLATLRHAIIACLRAPPKGFEEVSVRHFSLCRKRIVVQALRWMTEAEKTPIYPKFKKAYAELLSLLSNDAFQLIESLPPIQEDVEAVQNHNPILLMGLLDGDKNDERKPSAKRVSANRVVSSQQVENPGDCASVTTNTTGHAGAAVSAGYNPWAGPQHATGVFTTGVIDQPHYEDHDSDDDSLYS